MGNCTRFSKDFLTFSALDIPFKDQRSKQKAQTLCDFLTSKKEPKELEELFQT